MTTTQFLAFRAVPNPFPRSCLHIRTVSRCRRSRACRTRAECYANGKSTGQIISATSNLEVSGDLVNNGTLRLIGGDGLSVAGAFTNNGVLDIMTWDGTLPPGFVNNGTLLGRSAIKVDAAEAVGSDFEMIIHGYVGHNYQLQYCHDPSGGTWQNLGAPVAGADGPITLTHPSGANAPLRFYRVAVDP